VLGIRESDVVFSAAKLFFAYGLGNALTFPMWVGATAVLMAERPTPDAVFKRLVEEKPTIFYGVPTLYAALLVSQNFPPREKLSLRICTSAGEALPKNLGERWTERTGDHYLRDEDGYYVYQGRSDDMLKVGGIYVSPFEVEGALQSHPDVLEAAVVAWPDTDELIKPKAFVVLKTAGAACDALAVALQEHCKQ
jgi:acyl-coenzyme A synthetase/AMP-(fatty) acid ligase